MFKGLKRLGLPVVSVMKSTVKMYKPLTEVAKDTSLQHNPKLFPPKES